MSVRQGRVGLGGDREPVGFEVIEPGGDGGGEVAAAAPASARRDFRPEQGISPRVALVIFGAVVVGGVLVLGKMLE